jgi:hypothetical protein
MLIECNNCGAPLDVKGKEHIVKCAYCGTQTQLAAAKTVATATPAGWTPPAQWRPPEGARADHSQVFTYHRPFNVIRGVIFSTMLIALIGSFSGFMVMRQATNAVQTTAAAAIASSLFGNNNGAQSAMDQARRAIEQAAKGAANAASGATYDYFGPGGAAQAIAAFKTSLGTQSLVAEKLVLYPTYAILSARDPKKPKNFDRYSLQNGVVGDPDPISNSSIRSDIDKRIFDPDKVALAKLPALIKQTVDTLAYEDAKPSHVIVESNLPFTKGLVIRVYVSGPRDSGRIDFNADGSVNRVFK